jgi:uncharacterized protein (DUF427 family)
MKAIWHNEVIAQSHNTVVVEGNHYFPSDSLNMQFFKSSDKQTTCHWKGVAHYYDVAVGSASNPAAAWYYPSPKVEASQIQNHVAFWKGVSVIED